MGKSPCSSDEKSTVLKKGPWTPEEDQMLLNYINQQGHGNWRSLPKRAGLNRCGKSCRLRWTNYLRPDIKRGKFSSEEEQTILNLHFVLGNKWSAIAGHLPGRTDNEIKNFWNTHLKKKLIQMGFDPMSHRPATDIFSTIPHLIALASLKEMIDRRQWDDHSVRVQSEAAQIAKVQQLQRYLLQSSTATGSVLMLEPTNLTINNQMMMVTNNNYNNTPPLQTQVPDLTEIQTQPMMINEANDQGCSSSILPNLTDISAVPCSSNYSASNSGSGISSVTNTTIFWPDEFFLDVDDETFMSAGFP